MGSRPRAPFALCALLAACADPADESGSKVGSTAAAPWFEEVALERGIDFRHASGHDARYLFPETVCGGCALFDLEGDGDLDAYFVQAGNLTGDPAARATNRLFRNDGHGHFEDVTEASGTGDRGYGMGVATGDYDGDGDVDLYVTNLGPNVLLSNAGDGTFDDVTARAGVGERAWSSSAAFVDFDRDGDLDLFVVNYVGWSLADELECETPPHGRDYCSPKSYAAPAPDTLYRNEGDGRFTDVSFELGLRAAFGNGLGVVCGDFDADGATDVFVANDGSRNQLWRWDAGAGRFREEGALAGCAMAQDGIIKAGMGTAAADVDDDGREDLLVVNLSGESDSFFRNSGAWFDDETPRMGLGVVSRALTRFGCGLVDFDDDGRLDLFVTCGRVTKAAEPLGPDPYAEPNLVLRGLTDGRFEEVLPRGGVATPLVETSRAASFGDVDGDGAIDVLVVNRDGPARLYLNKVGGRSARFRLVDGRGSDALHAVLTGRVRERTVTRVLRTAYGYCAAHEAVVHIGLGDEPLLRDVEVRWPDGTRERFGDFETGRLHVLVRGRGR